MKGTIYDPLGLSKTYDVNWLREAELKHGRVCMLAFLGWVSNDAGLKFPGEAFQGVSSLSAHDAMVKSGEQRRLGANPTLPLGEHSTILCPDGGCNVTFLCASPVAAASRVCVRLAV